jgi:DNA-binding transcriptional LysR family regulator
MALDLELAASFLVLCEERHFGRAAVRLHLTSPALTKRIQRLERQLGVAVIERGPAGVLRVTAAGRRFADAAAPLLAHADAARAAARRRPARYIVRIGLPAGTGDFLAQVGLAGIVREIRRTCPEAEFVCCAVPFSAFEECLSSGVVDVLWTSAPVRHAGVESVPLRAGSPLIGVVAACHPLADARSVDVAAFCDEPILYNPVLPSTWMDPFWLADIRPRRDARLVEFDAVDQRSVLRKAAEGQAVLTIPAMMGPLLSPTLRGLALVGATRLGFHAARRRTDDRDAVIALIHAFQALAADAFTVAGGSSDGS